MCENTELNKQYGLLATSCNIEDLFELVDLDLRVSTEQISPPEQLVDMELRLLEEKNSPIAEEHPALPVPNIIDQQDLLEGEPIEEEHPFLSNINVGGDVVDPPLQQYAGELSSQKLGSEEDLNANHNGSEGYQASMLDDVLTDDFGGVELIAGSSNIKIEEEKFHVLRDKPVSFFLTLGDIGTINTDQTYNCRVYLTRKYAPLSPVEACNFHNTNVDPRKGHPILPVPGKALDVDYWFNPKNNRRSIVFKNLPTKNSRIEVPIISTCFHANCGRVAHGADWTIVFAIEDQDGRILARKASGLKSLATFRPPNYFKNRRRVATEHCADEPPAKMMKEDDDDEDIQGVGNEEEVVVEVEQMEGAAKVYLPIPDGMTGEELEESVQTIQEIWGKMTSPHEELVLVKVFVKRLRESA